MKKYYRNHYAEINDLDVNSNSSLEKWFNETKRYYELELSPHLGNVQNKKFLELGCGIGGFLNFLNSKKEVVYLGVDTSEEQLSVCKQYVTDNVVLADAIDFLKQNESSYDYIILFDFIEHLKKESIVDFVKLLYDNLNIGGKIIVRTPNMAYLFASYSRYLDFTHEFGFTEESITQVFRELPFKEIKVINTLIGRKKLLILKILRVVFARIYNMKLSHILTPNLLLIAQK
ncbi:MAG: hypothetical protein A2068_09730 [Ignavibacteria bacterium GWB2_35_6b]|nr:MAG: hypothetical protein A2068_09730 [Ignavibacteria bacterium GWB2_35_6b]